MKPYDIIVIGGGAAGLMAAGEAAKAGAKTLLLEKMSTPGRKLLISGKGRCNITNIAPVKAFIGHFGKNGRFLYSAFHRYFSDDLLAFLDDLNVATVTERGGRVFPASESAADVVNALVTWNRRVGVEIRTQMPVEQLKITDNTLTGVRTPQGIIPARAAILTTGGASYPGTGSSGDGYRLAREIGHTVVSTRPALVPLVTAGDAAQKCQGLSLRNVRVTLWIDGKKGESEFGEMLFTHFGVSGPIILTLSRGAVDALHAKKRVQISIDLKPALDESRLDARLLRDLDSGGKKQFHTLLKGLLPQKLIPVRIEQVGIPADKVCHQITAPERKRLLAWLKDFRLTVSGHRGYRQAIVTAGGVALNEIDPRTMASRRVAGLYLAGEVLDLDADTGGYNLQAAFSTGYLAGRSAAAWIAEQYPFNDPG